MFTNHFNFFTFFDENVLKTKIENLSPLQVRLTMPIRICREASRVQTASVRLFETVQKLHQMTLNSRSFNEGKFELKKASEYSIIIIIISKSSFYSNNH